MDAYESESRKALGDTNLVCAARQNMYQLGALISTEMGYTIAQKLLDVPNSKTLINTINSGEYPEYLEFKKAIELILEYLREDRFDNSRLLDIAKACGSMYFGNAVHSIYNGLVCQ